MERFIIARNKNAKMNKFMEATNNIKDFEVKEQHIFNHFTKAG